MSLNELRDFTQSFYRIEALQGLASTIERLEEMGFFAGAEIQIERRLPMQGPWIVHLGASSFALRSDEAACIVLKAAA